MANSQQWPTDKGRSIRVSLALLLLVSFGAWVGCGDAPFGTQPQALKGQSLASGKLHTLTGSLQIDIIDDHARGRSWKAYSLKELQTGRLVPLVMQEGRLHWAASPGAMGGGASTQLSLRSLQPEQLLTLTGSLQKQPEGTVFQAKQWAFQVEQVQLIGPPSVDTSSIGFASLPLGFKQMFGLIPAGPPVHSQTPIPILNPKAPIKRTLLILLVNLKNQKSWITDPKQAEDLALTKNNALYDQSTYALIQFTSDLNNDKKPDIYTVTINDTNQTSCKSNYNKWGTMADAEVAKQKVDTSQYNHVLYILPKLKTCGWNGVARVGSLTAKGPYPAWVQNSSYTFKTFSHELGHSIGMRHAAIDPDNDGAHNKSKTSEEYGDFSDYMGLRMATLNAPHRVEVGAFNRYPAQVVPAALGKKTYKLSALMVDPTQATHPQVLYFPHTKAGRMYYLSYKTKLATSYDKSIPTGFFGGVSIHTHTFTLSGQTLHVKTLKDGESYKDSNGISIKQIKAGTSPDEVSLELDIPAPPASCKPVQPVFQATSPTVTAGVGQTASLRFTLENKDPAVCPSAVLTVEVALPGGYQVTAARYARQSFSAAPGSKRTVIVYVINDGVTRDVKVTLNSPFMPGHQPVTRSVKVDVDADIPTTPTKLKGVVLSPTSVKLDWSPSTDKQGMRGYQVFRQLEQTGAFSYAGFTSHSPSRSPTYTDSRIPANTKVVSYYVKALDTNNNLSPPSNTVILSLTGSPEPLVEPTRPDAGPSDALGTEPLPEPVITDAGGAERSLQEPLVVEAIPERVRQTEPVVEVGGASEPSAESVVTPDITKTQPDTQEEVDTQSATPDTSGAPGNEGCGCSTHSGQRVPLGLLWVLLLPIIWRRNLHTRSSG